MDSAAASSLMQPELVPSEAFEPAQPLEIQDHRTVTSPRIGVCLLPALSGVYDESHVRSNE